MTPLQYKQKHGVAGVKRLAESTDHKGSLQYLNHQMNGNKAMSIKTALFLDRATRGTKDHIKLHESLPSLFKHYKRIETEQIVA